MREMRPRHIVLFIASCLILLGAICAVAEYEKSWLGPLRWPSLSSMLSTQPKQPAQPELANDLDLEADIEPEELVPFTVSDTLTLLAEVEETESLPEPAEAEMPSESAEEMSPTPVVKPDTLPEVKPATGVLEAFIAGLADAGSKQVRVVHYGDSQIEEDRITATIRRNLQAKYGGGGVGILPLYQTIPTRTIRQTLLINGKPATSKTAPKRYIVYGPKNQQREDDIYGPMGQVAVMDTSLRAGSDSLVLHIEPNGKRSSSTYFSQVRLFKSDNIEVNARSADILTLPDSTNTCTLEFIGQGDVYGVSLETPKGIIMDNIPMRGGSGNVFTRMNADQLRTFFRETNTRLIILQFGGNVMPWADSPERVRGYANSMRRQIRHLRACAPNASILFVGPSDMTTVIDGERSSYPMLPVMDRQLAQMAASEGIAYWSLYQAMGGWNSMMAWGEKGLAASDGVHFSQGGADKAGNLLWKWLETQINKRK